MHKTSFNISYITFEVINNEVRIEIQEESNKPIGFQYPTYFITQYSDSIIIPHGEGMVIPANQNLDLNLFMSGATGHGVCMSFYAAARYENENIGKEGYIVIIETPDDVSVQMTKENQCQYHIVYPYWHSQKELFGYNRKLRMVFFPDGGHVKAAKIYRDYSIETGKLVTFEQKAAKYPALKETYKMMQGAPNIWIWYDYQRIYDEIKNVYKWTNILASETDGTTVDWAKRNGIVPSRYDIYQDAVDPALKSQFDWNRDWVDDAYANDELVLNKDGSRRQGWGVYPKNGGNMIYAGVVSDKYWPKYMKKKINNEMTNGIKRLSRFIDTATASDWYEDYHANHPSNRSLSKHQRYVTLNTLHEDYGLIVGSETGHDMAVGACDYFEGMMSLPMFRTNDPGRNMENIVYNPEERAVKYQVGERYRVPLWELVYHDCVIAYWYWGDYNNKMPTL